MYFNGGKSRMKIIDRYDFAENSKERYRGTIFLMGETEVSKTHGISYVQAREQMKDIGLIMGLEVKVK